MPPSSALTGIVTLTLAAAAAGAEGLVWIEAERFDQPGGWAVDSQFIDQMNSPYLLAVGLGTPVEDASTSVSLPRAGRYRLWARTKDWMPEHHPGRFSIAVNGRAVEHVFGESGRPGWRWEDGGIHDLREQVGLRLHDLTGYYGRCDAIVFAEDLQWMPSDDRAAVARLRGTAGGVSRQIEDEGNFDVVVVGGGLAGCTAAVAAARGGSRTALVQNRPVLGGNASVEIVVPPVGVWPYGEQDPLDPRETGIVEEYRGAGVQTTDDGKAYSARLARLVAAEPNLTLYLNTHAAGVEMASPGRISHVLAVDTRTGQRRRIAAKMFIDCTGDGAVGVAAGAEYRHGREARSMYGESMAPETGDRQTMGNSLKYVSQPTGQPQPFTPPAWAMEFPRCEDFTPGRHPRLSHDIQWQWMIELGGTRDTYADAEEIRDELLRLIFGMWDHVKNHCPLQSGKAAEHRLVWVGHVAGKRESRRLIGDYVLTQNDIATEALLADRVAYGGWGIDDHFPEGFFYDGPPAQHDYKDRRFSIPLRSLYSQNIQNLLMAGRNISASHVAMSATRVMLTCAVMGQAAGTAAAMCVDRGVTPRELGQAHLESLQQQLLKDGAHLIDLANADPLDLARQATVSASSERSLLSGERMAAVAVADGCARAAHGQTHAWGPDPAAPLPQWLELAWKEDRSFNMVHVTFQTRQHAPASFRIETSRDGAPWRAAAEVAGNRQRRHVLGLDRTAASKLRVVLLERGAADPAVCEIRVYDEPQSAVEAARRRARRIDLPDDEPALPWDESLVWVTGVDPRKLPGMVIDSTQAEAVGRWVSSDHTPPFVLNGYLHDGNAGKGEKSIRFAPPILRPDRYDIRLAYTPGPNRATAVPVTIRTSRETRTVTVNQRARPPIDSLFISLGVFDLAAAEPLSIEIRNAGTDGYVVVDAVQLVPARP